MKLWKLKFLQANMTKMVFIVLFLLKTPKKQEKLPKKKSLLIMKKDLHLLLK